MKTVDVFSKAIENTRRRQSSTFLKRAANDANAIIMVLNEREKQTFGNAAFTIKELANGDAPNRPIFVDVSTVYAIIQKIERENQINK